MYMNSFQKRIALLIDEYGGLTKKQLLAIVNAEFGSGLPNLDGYIKQMCKFDDYEEVVFFSGSVLVRRGTEPDYDIIRSIEVMLCFFPDVVSHHKARAPVALRFYKNSGQNMKEISVIPVKYGDELSASSFVQDKFAEEKSGVVIFLLESREQMKLIKANGKFAVIEKDAVKFFKK